jgi:hypothetical protein
MNKKAWLQIAGGPATGLDYSKGFCVVAAFLAFFA